MLSSVPCSEHPPVVAADAPTFYKDVLPILQANCQTCHRPGEVAPMSLLTYEQARPWARAIKAAVVSKQDAAMVCRSQATGTSPTSGGSSIARSTRSRRGSMPARPRATKPMPRRRSTFESGWNIKPDIIVEMPKAFELPARGTINYKYILVKTELQGGHVGHRRRDASRRSGGAAPRQGVGAAARIEVDGEGGARRSVREPRAIATSSASNAIEEGNDILGKFNPGLGAQRFDMEGAAKFVPKGSDLVFELHYTTSGKPTSDVSKLGLVLAKAAAAEALLLPRRTDGAQPRDSCRATARPKSSARSRSARDAQLVYAQPHMHLRGKDFELRVVSPDKASRRPCSRAT